MTADDEEVEQIDLLAALQRSLTRAKDGARAASPRARATKAIREGQDTGDARPMSQIRRERGIKAGATRRAANAGRLTALADRKAPTGYRIGTWVRTHTRSRPFDNRIGVVVTNNLGEVGVGFGFDWAIQLPGVDAWFLPSELERVR